MEGEGVIARGERLSGRGPRAQGVVRAEWPWGLGWGVAGVPGPHPTQLPSATLGPGAGPSAQPVPPGSTPAPPSLGHLPEREAGPHATASREGVTRQISSGSEYLYSPLGI